MKYQQTFTVEGSGSFPYDMLRYERCWPANESQSPLLESYPVLGGEDRNRLRQVQLMRSVETKQSLPEFRRWQSFTWRVIEESISTYRTN